MTFEKPDIQKQWSIATIDLGYNDAKFDHLEKYYCDTGVVDKIEKGNKSIIIGRKGTGKTALAYYIKQKYEPSWNKFTAILSFKDIPVHLLEQFSDDEHTQANKYITLWKYIFLIELSKIILQDVSIDDENYKKLKTFLELNFPTLKVTPRQYLKTTIERKFRLDFKTVSAEQSVKEEEGVLNLMTFLSDLEELCIKSAGRDKTIKLFIDELDDIYEDKEEYFQILAAMFKAGMEINAKFKSDYKNVSVVMLLRDDIYSKIQYSDKNKWSDFTEYLDWTPKPNLEWHEQNLFQLINLRIGASLVDESNRNENYFYEVFENKKIARKYFPFEYILSRTLLRPRDVIQFCKVVFEQTESRKGKKVAYKDISNADFEYSRWLRNELYDELRPRLNEVETVFEALKIYRQATFYLQDSNLNRVLQRHGITDRHKISDIFNLFFEFSIVGQFDDDKQKVPYFKYKNPHIKFSKQKLVCMHYGLRPVLNMKFNRSRKVKK